MFDQLKVEYDEFVKGDWFSRALNRVKWDLMQARNSATTRGNDRYSSEWV